MDVFHWTRWPPELKMEKKQLKMLNYIYWTQFQNNFTEMLHICPFTKIFKIEQESCKSEK